MNELLRKEQKTIIDVRETWEFEEEHYPGAVNIPLSMVPLHLSEIRDMPRPILLYCRSGSRSSMAATMLRNAGIEETYNAGGLYDLKPFQKN
jgi:phage shock protein E